jgi:hypothetical protein
MEKVSTGIRTYNPPCVRHGCSYEKAHPGAFLTCASVDRECRKCILKQCDFRVLAGWGKSLRPHPLDYLGNFFQPSLNDFQEGPGTQNEGRYSTYGLFCS